MPSIRLIFLYPAIFILTGCKSEPRVEPVFISAKRSIQKGEPRPLQLYSSQAILAHWLETKPSCIRIKEDDAQDLLLSDYRLLKKFMETPAHNLIQFQKRNMAGGPRAEILVKLGWDYSYLYQWDPKTASYKKIWDYWHDDGGSARITNLGLLEIMTFYPCSDCSVCSHQFFKVATDTLFPVFNFYSNYNFDEPWSKNNFVMNWDCGAYYYQNDSGFTLQYVVGLKEQSSRVRFIQQTIEVAYAWDDSTKFYLPIKYSPEEFSPFIAAVRMNAKNDVSENKKIFRACMHWKREELINLKTRSEFQKTIHNLEQGYHESWIELINYFCHQS